MNGKNSMNANISKELRKEVYRRDGFRCALCDSTDGIQIHHVKPRGRGGADHPMNLITLCWRCHAAAHGSILLLDEYPSHDEFPNIEQQIRAMMDELELACVEYVSATTPNGARFGIRGRDDREGGFGPPFFARLHVVGAMETGRKI